MKPLHEFTDLLGRQSVPFGVSALFCLHLMSPGCFACPLQTCVRSACGKATYCFWRTKRAPHFATRVQIPAPNRHFSLGLPQREVGAKREGVRALFLPFGVYRQNQALSKIISVFMSQESPCRWRTVRIE